MIHKTCCALALLTAAAALQGCGGLIVAGAAGGATLAADRRAPDTLLQDQAIELDATNRIYDDADLRRGTHINVTSIDYDVLLTGEAHTAALKQRVIDTVKGIDGVRYISDEIAVAEPASLATRTQDTWLTAKVKGQFLNMEGLRGLRIKVVTERGIVYLMGVVTHAEGRQAAAMAKQIDGVDAVVKEFEYLD